MEPTCGGGSFRLAACCLSYAWQLSGLDGIAPPECFVLLWELMASERPVTDCGIAMVQEA
jgi:hypothetical protein